ncbi:PQ-loop domain-containing transporter [Ureaplasma ceti]|uniref:Uncharacterized protein n=1 Tax=Ureaplasma ceti TaxID=3119530 RepID=A0ABP9U6W0_9BACT
MELATLAASVNNGIDKSLLGNPDGLFSGASGAYEVLLIIFGTIGSVIISFCYIPQFVTTFKTKGTTGLSFIMWLLVVIAEAGFIIWGILYVAEGSLATNNITALKDLGFLSDKATVDNLNLATLNAANKQAVDSGLINGLALFVCDVSGFIVALLILIYKVKNMILAKKMNITEAALCEKLYAEVLAKQQAKENVTTAKNTTSSQA